MAGRAVGRIHPLEPYVPRILAEWELDAPGRIWQRVDGTVCFVDVSGFTNLSEKLARRGRIGAEELTDVLDRVFGDMLRLAYDRGGSLLKFGGDALLLLFEGRDHALQGTCAAVEMRAALREAVKIPTSVGKIRLRMSVGVHTGPVDLFRVGGPHHELIVTGDTATTTTQMEGSADAGEIVISPALADLLPEDAAGDQKGTGRLLRWRRARVEPSGPTPRRSMDGETYERSVPVELGSFLSVARSEAEHRIATVGFVKFKGIADVWAESGPGAVAAGLDRLVTTVQQAAADESVTFLASDIDEDGGKSILITGVPTTQEDDEGRMLRALRRIADSQQVFPLKVGTNRGHVFAGEIGTEFRSTYTVMGDTVNLAARLMAAAPPGRLYASPSVLDRSSTLFRTEPLEPFFVKGKEQPVLAYEVFEETARRPPEARHELPFGGREAELQRVIDACQDPDRRVATVSGDTGIGKSRLVVEALRRLDRPTTLRIQGEPNSSDNPYWAFRDPLRRHLGIQRRSQAEMVADLSEIVRRTAPTLEASLPLLGDVLHIEVPETDHSALIDPKFRPDRIADALIALFDATAGAGLAVVLEDVHWFDDSSEGLAQRLVEVAADEQWAVLVTTRRPDSSFAVGEHIALGPISDHQLRSVAIEATSAAPLRPHELDAVVDRADGNPLFLSEILRIVRETGLSGQLPESLDAVVSTEIDTLPTLTRQLLRQASVLGRSFRRVVLDEFLAPDGVVLDQATRRTLGRFIEADGSSRFRFRHAVVHDVAYQGLSFRRRRELHARAGRVIEQLAGRDTQAVAEFLASHYAVAGVHDKAFEFSCVAAEKARSAYSHTEAEVHYARAIEAARYGGFADAVTIADLWTGVGEVREASGQFEAARDAYAEALRLTADPTATIDLHIHRARTWIPSGRLSSARRNLTLGRKHLEAIPDDDRRLRALARLDSFEAAVCMYNGDAHSAADIAARAALVAREVGEQEALARSLTVVDWANVMLGRMSEHRRGPEAIEILERLGLLDRAADAMNNLGGYSYFEGDWDGAADWYRRSITTAERAGNALDAAFTRANLAEILVGQRRFDEADVLIDESERVLRASNSTSHLPFVQLQRARSLVGRRSLEAALALLDSLHAEAVGSGDPFMTVDITVNLAAALTMCGRPADSLARLDDVEAAHREEAAFFGAAIERERARALIALGSLDEARSAIRNGLNLARQEGNAYEEALLLEVESEQRGRTEEPGPAPLSVLIDLRQALGILHTIDEPVT